LAVANFARVSISSRRRSFATMLVCRDAREQMTVQLQLVEVVADTLTVDVASRRLQLAETPCMASAP